MGYTVPNGPDAGTADQAEPDALDYEALGVRNTGVVSGCGVSAQVSPDMSVAVAAGQVVVDGVPVEVDSGSVTIQTSDANARFDLIVVDSAGTKSVVRGAASASNPVFPDLDLTQYAWLASVYVGASTSNISAAAIVDKRVEVQDAIRQFRSDPDAVIIESNVGGEVTSITASGKISWVESTLKRLSSRIMELASTLVIKSADGDTEILTLKARPTAPENQSALEVQAANGDPVAYISGTGDLQAANFYSGEGPPSGAIAPSGAVYSDTLAPRNRTLWVHEGEGVWTPLRSFDPSDDSIPVGTVMPYLGRQGAEPVGWVGLYGQNISTSDPETRELALLVGATYGSGPGVVTLPDFRGRIPIGEGGDVALSLGDIAGSSTQTLSVGNLPAHDHAITDPGHAHPSGGRALYGTPAGSLKPTTDNPAVPFAVNQEESSADRSSSTGVTVGSTGSGQPFGIMPPVAAVNWIVKAYATYARVSAVSDESVIRMEENGVITYSTVGDIATAVAANPLVGGPVVSALPPVAAPPGTIWVMTPDDHVAIYTPTGWKPLYPQTSNNAVTLGDSTYGITGLWGGE